MDKSTQAFKKLNKGYKQQNQQIHSKIQSSLQQSVKGTLNKGAAKLRKSTVSRVQNFYQDNLDRSMDDMFQRLSVKMTRLQEESFEQKKKDVNTVRDQVQVCINEELTPLITQAVDSCL